MGNEIQQEGSVDELQMLMDNIELLLANRLTVYEKEKLFYCKIEDGNIGALPAGVFVLPLGVLIKLWESGDFLAKCPDCGNTVYIISAVGSMGSGSNQYKAFCPKCSKKVIGRKKSMILLMKPSLDLYVEYCEDKQQRESLSLSEVIEYLKSA